MMPIESNNRQQNTESISQVCSKREHGQPVNRKGVQERMNNLEMNHHRY